MHGTNPHTQITRRNLIAAAPLAGLSAASLSSVGNAAVAETPIMALYREWQTLFAAEAQIPDTDSDDVSPEWTAARERTAAVEQRIAALPCSTPLDWIIKISLATGSGAFACPADEWRGLWKEARALIGGAS